MSLWANVPHYLSNTPNPKAMYALVRRVLGVLDHPLDLHDVETAVSDFESKVAEVIANNPAVASYVRQLEERESDEGEDSRAGIRVTQQRSTGPRAGAIPAAATPRQAV